MDIREVIEKSIAEQRNSLLDIPEGAAEAIGRAMQDLEEGSTKERASDNALENLGGYVNVIPSKTKIACTPILITLCYDKDSFEGRIMESLDHAEKQCPGICEHIFFITTQWNSVIANKLSGCIGLLRKSGVEIRFIHITEKFTERGKENGIVLMPL
mgnify:FL=1